MATPKAQRIGIWIIAIVMAIGTIGSFAVMVLANQNNAKDQQKQLDAYNKYLKEQKKQQAARQKTLRPLDGYTAAAFDADTVTKLGVTTLKAGDGEALRDGSVFSVNYFGWTADGKIFDSTNVLGKTTPAEGLTLAKGSLIDGWVNGLVGKQVGSTVELTIPTAEAYGTDAAAQGQPAGPLKFIVEITAIKN